MRALFPDGDVVLVGDGATDLEARDVCARFVAFAGVELRADVVAGADRSVLEPDLALVYLSQAFEDIAAAALYSERDEVTQEVTFVGFGRFGLGDVTRRVGSGVNAERGAACSHDAHELFDARPPV